jgi:1-acyl-sn-glycerol-3-phosphate acyltransferase
VNPSAKPRAVLLAPLRVLYALWAVGVFLLVGLIALVLLVLLPRVGQRRAAARAAARLFLMLAGMPLSVRFAQRLPAGQCVVVCNHVSYLDGIVLTAALPPSFGFVIKREMANVPLVGALLKRLGSQFVERFDRQRSAVDARRVLRSASAGQSMVFFPEGTYPDTPSGLLKFHLGAFVTAVRVGCPLVPAVVRGTRRALPPKGLPLPGPIEFEVLPAFAPAAAAEEQMSVPRLRDAARAAMQAALGESEITCCDDTGRPPDTAPERSARASRP